MRLSDLNVLLNYIFNNFFNLNHNIAMGSSLFSCLIMKKTKPSVAVLWTQTGVTKVRILSRFR
jgi:hypothetical protein